MKVYTDFGNCLGLIMVKYAPLAICMISNVYKLV